MFSLFSIIIYLFAFAWTCSANYYDETPDGPPFSHGRPISSPGGGFGGSRPQQAGSGSRPQQGGPGSRPQHGGFGGGSQQGGSGSRPQQGGPGSRPQHGGFGGGSPAQQGGTGSRPQHGGFGGRPQHGGFDGSASDLDPIEALSLAIPGGGRAGEDYPILAFVPDTGFACDSLPGYYADTGQESRCQVFHICQHDGRLDSFLCPNGTLFNQKYFVCDWWYNVDCDASSQFFELNALIGVVQEGSSGTDSFGGSRGTSGGSRGSPGGSRGSPSGSRGSPGGSRGSRGGFGGDDGEEVGGQGSSGDGYSPPSSIQIPSQEYGPPERGDGGGSRQPPRVGGGGARPTSRPVESQTQTRRVTGNGGSRGGRRNGLRTPSQLYSAPRRYRRRSR